MGPAIRGSRWAWHVGFGLLQFDCLIADAMDKAVQSYKYIKQNTIIEKLEEM